MAVNRTVAVARGCVISVLVLIVLMMIVWAMTVFVVTVFVVTLFVRSVIPSRAGVVAMRRGLHHELLGAPWVRDVPVSPPMGVRVHVAAVPMGAHRGLLHRRSR